MLRNFNRWQRPLIDGNPPPSPRKIPNQIQIGKQALACFNLHPLFLSTPHSPPPTPPPPSPPGISSSAPPLPGSFTLTRAINNSSRMISRLLALNSCDPATGYYCSRVVVLKLLSGTT
ncbi:Uncharacterized protein Fot_35970 [Forsythia ovata]|uniref:Uncharacterized protein n=1 Tax=Forsythia ovata TaxID=205694 RepID=A0ABD1SN42_9LAMI